MLDLRQFLLRVQVLHLYRAAVRSVRRAPAPARGELLQTIREEMERDRNVKDPQQIRFLLSEGNTHLKELNSMLGIQGTCLTVWSKSGVAVGLVQSRRYRFNSSIQLKSRLLGVRFDNYEACYLRVDGEYKTSVHQPSVTRT